MHACFQICGLEHCPAFWRDRRFHGLLLAGGIFWLGLWWWVPGRPITLAQLWSSVFLVLVVWQPVLEEVLFRGYMQGQCLQQLWGQRRWAGVTVANGCTALCFTAGHFWAHPPLWAAAVLVPALAFGYCRDRYASVYPCIVLHVVYNAGYFCVTGLS
ncbi:MAG: JDVT-CTERM system CAAX-type protease [Candidatus Tectomicrobia bacterium]|uniref:JDVT-CTERM system CAAX-type protease n=1 Tax=Tectimicrobiota bacterium TaxID=2528274 RepID=A0A937VZE5_UNCTE|nr:JDVT-CTERM system CAAX-type protease [Candidatus Tectomicrobia bacterium]